MAAAMKIDIEMAIGTSAADSEPSNCSNSKFKKVETMMASSSNNQGESFNSMGSEHYSAAAEGDFEKFKDENSEALAKILTPNDNTILHIHITARPPPKSSTSQVLEGDFVSRILRNCQALLWKANKKGETLLHMAARHGHFDVAEYLLQKYNNTPYPNHDRDNQEQKISPTKRMLKTKSHDAKDTALHEAVRYHHLDVVKVLTKANTAGETPLASQRGELTYEANTAGETPLYLAAERGYAEVLKEILRNCSSPGDHGPYDRTALHVAVIRKDEDMVDTLLKARGMIHKSKQDQHGWTPLHFAAHLGYIEILRKLLRNDQSVAYKADNKGKTALHVAAGQGRVDVMQELISTCPDCCELVDERGQNVLHFALESKNRKAVKLVLENPWLGNLINEKDENGNTPFLHAISMSYFHAASKIYYNLSDSRADIKVFNHYRVDMQVFNHHNHNAADIISTSEPISEPISSDLILWVLKKYKVKRGLRMIVSKNDNIGERKDEVNTVKSKSKSKEDGGVEAEGNRMSSKSKNGKGIANLMTNIGQIELVVAILIATVTFAAGFTVPGGFVAEKGLDQGTAILTRNTAFRAFVILNTISMFFSSLAVLIHLVVSTSTHVLDMRELFLEMRLRRLLIEHALVFMIGAFLSGTFAVLHRDRNLAISICVVPVAMYAFLQLSSNNLEHLTLFRWKMERKRDNFIKKMVQKYSR